MDNKREWKEFFFTDIFTDIKRGKRLKKADHKEGRKYALCFLYFA